MDAQEHGRGNTDCAPHIMAPAHSDDDNNVAGKVVEGNIRNRIIGESAQWEADFIILRSRLRHRSPIFVLIT